MAEWQDTYFPPELNEIEIDHGKYEPLLEVAMNEPMPADYVLEALTRKGWELIAYRAHAVGFFKFYIENVIAIKLKIHRWRAGESA